MNLAIMQPYFFPYIGYFQLIKAVDKFVFYDDVNFIKQGWINRNRILNNGSPLLFTVPLENASSFLKINEVNVNKKQYFLWKGKFLKTLEANYKKAPLYNTIANLVATLLNNWDGTDIADLAKASVISVCDYLKIDTKIVNSSSIYNNNALSGKERVIDICKQESCERYINPIGGQVLYNATYFNGYNIDLKFIKSVLSEYKQINADFLPGLSIIDVLMFNEKDKIVYHLDQYQLV